MKMPVDMRGNPIRCRTTWAWAVVNKEDAEIGVVMGVLEIYKTRRIARGLRENNQKVVKVYIVASAL